MRAMMILILLLLIALVVSEMRNQSLEQRVIEAEERLAAYKYEDFKNDEDY